MALRNVIHRRQHKERGQLAHRKKLGLLEKHKDYVLRARDHESKKLRLQRLRQKAATRNDDEFYWAMIKGQQHNGAHLAHRETETALPIDVVALLKTQDASYVQAQLRAETKRIAELEQRIAAMLPHLRAEWLADKPERASTLRAAKLLPEVVREEGTVGAMGKKTVWCEGGRDEVRKYRAPAAPLQAEAGPSRAGITSSVSKGKAPSAAAGSSLAKGKGKASEDEWSDADSDSDAGAEAGTSPGLRAFEKHASYQVSLLAARQARLAALRTAAHKLDTVRALMATRGGNARKVSAREASARDAVARGTVAKGGLAVPADEDGERTRSWKWSSERKR